MDSYENYCDWFLKENIIAFGNFKLTFGGFAKVYVDLYRLLNHAEMQDKINTLFIKLIKENDIDFDYVCGAAYAGLSFASLLAYKLNKPMVIREKEKQANLKNKIYPIDVGSKCLIVEEVVASGRTVLEIITDLKDVGFNIAGIVTVMDRSQNGTENLKQLNYNTHALFDFMSIVNNLYERACITADQYNACAEDCTIKFNIYAAIESNPLLVERKRIPYEVRKNISRNSAASRLFDLMSEKKTNLCIEVIQSKLDDMLEICENVGSYICMFIIHSDALLNFNENDFNKLKQLADTKNFMILDNRKFSSLTEFRLYRNSSVFRYIDFISICTALPYPDAIRSEMSTNTFDKGIFIVTSLGGDCGMLKRTDEFIQFGSENSDIVAGIITLSTEVISSELIYTIPNINNLNFASVIDRHAADIAILVITDKGDFLPKEIEKISSVLWNSYTDRIK